VPTADATRRVFILKQPVSRRVPADANICTAPRMIVETAGSIEEPVLVKIPWAKNNTGLMPDIC